MSLIHETIVLLNTMEYVHLFLTFINMVELFLEMVKIKLRLNGVFASKIVNSCRKVVTFYELTQMYKKTENMELLQITMSTLNILFLYYVITIIFCLLTVLNKFYCSVFSLLLSIFLSIVIAAFPLRGIKSGEYHNIHYLVGYIVFLQE